MFPSRSRHAFVPSAALAVAALLAGPACEREEEDELSPIASCTYADAGLCTEGPNKKDNHAAKAECQAPDPANGVGVFAEKACNRTGMVHECALSDPDDPAATATIVFTAPYTVPAAQVVCARYNGNTGTTTSTATTTDAATTTATSTATATAQ